MDYFGRTKQYNSSKFLGVTWDRPISSYLGTDQGWGVAAIQAATAFSVAVAKLHLFSFV